MTQIWEQILLLCLLIHKSCSEHREAMVIWQRHVCSSRLLDSPSFTPVRGVTQCALLYLESGAHFMLVRRGANGAVECGYTSRFKAVPCMIGTEDIAVYAKPVVLCVGEYHFKGSVYCLHMPSKREKKHDAVQYCSSVRGCLLEMDTKDDLIVVQNYTKSISDFYVDADDDLTEGEFRWKSGDLVDQRMFDIGEPDGKQEHCVAFNTTSAMLFDHSCVLSWPIVCKVPIL